ncbi:hypothetical protein PENTCL1PPCAC_27197 [Pristionchus entomophagus]|uniref:CULT domain-containing protein n=1 Tax=Pristionchus entomophagus TaxID=358040 RepID=A0AAV5UF53_9BILA|nr:hypothetical protein PENTCL1PPCAC_27197 [Pristionchus entomophagus]
MLLLMLLVTAASAHMIHMKNGGEHDLICRACGKTITQGTFVTKKSDQMSSPSTIDYDYEMAVGGTNTTIHVFTNPAGERFHVLNALDANVRLNTDPTDDATWYPGYTWVITTCSHCGAHMGWYFESREDRTKVFHGIVLDKVISGEYCDSLIRIPGGKP